MNGDIYVGSGYGGIGGSYTLSGSGWLSANNRLHRIDRAGQLCSPEELIRLGVNVVRLDITAERARIALAQ